MKERRLAVLEAQYQAREGIGDPALNTHTQCTTHMLEALAEVRRLQAEFAELHAAVKRFLNAVHAYRV